MKFKNLVIATAAVFALASCNNNDFEENLGTENGKLEVTFKMPSQPTQGLTRGIVSNEHDLVAPSLSVSNALLSLKTASGERIANKYLVGDNLLENGVVKFTITGKNIATTNKIEVVVNNKESLEYQGTSIVDVQAGANGLDVARAIYTATSTEGDIKDEGEINNVKTFTAKLTASSIIARSEVYGKVKFDDKFVKEMRLAYVTPIGYRSTYGSDTKVALARSEKNVLGLGAVREEGGVLYEFGDSEFNLDDFNPVYKEAVKEAVNYKAATVVNHLFKGDETRMYVGFYITRYALLYDADGKYMEHKTEKSPIYQAADGSNTLYTRRGNDFVKLDEEGNAVSAASESDIKKYNALRFYTIKGFGQNGSRGSYEGGIDYLLDLGKINWGGESGKPFDPETNPGREDPDTNDGKSTITIDVTIKPWELHQPGGIDVSDNVQ